MNKYGQMAYEHWMKYAPKRVRKMDDPKAFFTQLGQEVQERVTELAIQLEPASKPGGVETIRLMEQAKQEAEEIVLDELVWLDHEEYASDAKTLQAVWEMVIDNYRMHWKGVREQYQEDIKKEWDEVYDASTIEYEVRVSERASKHPKWETPRHEYILDPFMWDFAREKMAVRLVDQHREDYYEFLKPLNQLTWDIWAASGKSPDADLHTLDVSQITEEQAEKFLKDFEFWMGFHPYADEPAFVSMREEYAQIDQEFDWMAVEAVIEMVHARHRKVL